MIGESHDPAARTSGGSSGAGPAVLAVAVGGPRSYRWLGREVRSSIFKSPVAGSVRVLDDRLDGDRQADPEHHGGADKAVHVYAQEDVDWWAPRLDRPDEPALFGENLRVTGVDLQAATIGERWRIGSAELQVSEPRTPCWKLGLRLDDPGFPRRFAAARRSGLMLRVLVPGALSAGDGIEVVDRPTHGVTVGDINRIYYGRGEDLTPMRRATELAAHWHGWMAHRTVWHLADDRA